MRLAAVAVALAACTQPLPAEQAVVAARPAVGTASGPAVVEEGVVEMEVSGRVDAANAPDGKLVVVITEGPCFQPGSHFVGVAPARVGEPFALHVFPPARAKLDVCAALIVGGQRLTPWHGRGENTPLFATAQGHLKFTGIDVKLSRLAPVRVPDSLKIE